MSYIFLYLYSYIYTYSYIFLYLVIMIIKIIIIIIFSFLEVVNVVSAFPLTFFCSLFLIRELFKFLV